MQTEFSFALPRGYVDQDGETHREGIMRLATAADEILPIKDHRVQINPQYLMIIILSRVITKLGNIEQISTRIMESLFTSDFNYLQEFYHKINGGAAAAHGVVTCPHCAKTFQPDTTPGKENAQ